MKATANDVRERFDTQKIDSLFADVDQCELPGAAVGIAIGGEPVYRKGFGLANMELPVLLSSQTRMRIGSTTKHLTSLAYLLLCEQGAAHLDDPIGKYVPEVHPVSRSATVRQLMGHVSGIRDVHDLSWHFAGTGHKVPKDVLLNRYAGINDTNALPNSVWIYNNGGYLLLSVAIERITGQPLADVLDERVFRPVGMRDTFLRPFDSNFVPNSAALHGGSPKDGFDKSTLGTEHSGEGGVVSTIDDMLRWLAHMGQPELGSPETWELLKRPLMLANGTSTGYGLGLFVSQYRGVRVISHAGGVLGGNSQMLKIPEQGLDVVVITNRDDVLAMERALKIVDACLQVGAAVEKGDGRSPISGLYRSRATGRVIQMSIREGRQIVLIDGSEVPFERCRGPWRPEPVWKLLRQEISAEGEEASPEGIRFKDFGNPDELQRCDAPKEPTRPPPQGRFAVVAGQIEATILVTDGVPLLETWFGGSGATYALEPLAEDLWRARARSGTRLGGGIVSFATDGQSFLYTSPRTRALPFTRST